MKVERTTTSTIILTKMVLRFNKLQCTYNVIRSKSFEFTNQRAICVIMHGGEASQAIALLSFYYYIQDDQSWALSEVNILDPSDGSIAE